MLSSDVAVGNNLYASQYNNLRADVRDVAASAGTACGTGVNNWAMPDNSNWNDVGGMSLSIATGATCDMIVSFSFNFDDLFSTGDLGELQSLVGAASSITYELRGHDTYMPLKSATWFHSAVSAGTATVKVQFRRPADRVNTRYITARTLTVTVLPRA